MSAATVSGRVRALAVLLVAFGMLGAAELSGRIGYAWLDHARAGKLQLTPFLKPYEMPDPAHPGNWVLRPGQAMTLAEVRALLHGEGLVVGEEALEAGARALGVADDAVIYRTNAEGYKGPPLDRSGTRPRVLAIGDSCTFGSLFERSTWPRSAERALAGLGVPAEVVNAGVNGYAPANALVRLDEFRALAPRIAVLYIGWNALYADRSSPARKPFALERLVRTIAARLALRGKDPRQVALEAYRRPKHPDASDPAIARAARFRATDLGDVETLARGLAQSGVRVVLATLPGLYLREEAPSERALAIGHLPLYTDNPYVIAALADGWNVALREMAPRIGAELVDLDAWSRTALRPRDAYFVDAVHLTEAGQERIGGEIARAIAPDLAASAGARAAGG